jgi:hypothetical protein
MDHMNKHDLPDFSGKCLSLKILESEHSHDLYDPHFEVQAGRLFLIGTIPQGSSASGWDANQTGAVAWEHVRNYVLFESLEAFERAIEISEGCEVTGNSAEMHNHGYNTDAGKASAG